MVSCRSTRQRTNERGVTLVEMMVSSALLLVVSTVFYSVFIASQRAGQVVESQTDLAQHGQKVLNDLKATIIGSRFLAQDDALGQGYLAKLSLPTGFAAEAGSRLPEIKVDGAFVPDGAGETITGNSLLVARQLPPTEVTDASTAKKYLVDRYQLRYVFLDRNPARRFKDFAYYLDLVQADSPVLFDHEQLDALPSGARKAAQKQGEYAWKVGQDAASAFYTLNSSGTLVPFGGSAKVAMTARSLLPLFAGGRVSGAMHYSVGMTTAPALKTPDPVNLFAQPQDSFPGGFEVLAVGPAGARKVMFRLALLAYFDRRISSKVTTVTATAINM